MVRLPLVAAAFACVLAFVTVSASALGQISSAIAIASPGGNPGPLIIRITRPSPQSEGDLAPAKQTRCLLEWSGGLSGQYTKHCTSSPLSH
jgi:hypothetical protein